MGLDTSTRQHEQQLAHELQSRRRGGGRRRQRKQKSQNSSLQSAASGVERKTQRSQTLRREAIASSPCCFSETATMNTNTSRHLSKNAKKERRLVKGISKVMKESKDYIREEILMPRYVSFVRCLKKNRDMSVDRKAIKLYNQLTTRDSNNGSDGILTTKESESIWFETRGKGYKYFHAYLKKWDVEINLEYYNAVLRMMHSVGAEGATSSSKSAAWRRHILTQFSQVFDAYLNEEYIFLTPIQKSTIGRLHAKLDGIGQYSN